MEIEIFQSYCFHTVVIPADGTQSVARSLRAALPCAHAQNADFAQQIEFRRQESQQYESSGPSETWTWS